MEKKVSKLTKWAIGHSVVGAIFVLQGFNKMFRYDDSSWAPVNAYVGGDAYNFIINGTYATAYFVLAAGCMIAATIEYCFAEILKPEEPAVEEGAVRETNTPEAATEVYNSYPQM